MECFNFPTEVPQAKFANHCTYIVNNIYIHKYVNYVYVHVWISSVYMYKYTQMMDTFTRPKKFKDMDRCIDLPTEYWTAEQQMT